MGRAPVRAIRARFGVPRALVHSPRFAALAAVASLSAGLALAGCGGKKSEETTPPLGFEFDTTATDTATLAPGERCGVGGGGVELEAERRRRLFALLPAAPGEREPGGKRGDGGERSETRRMNQRARHTKARADGADRGTSHESDKLAEDAAAVTAPRGERSAPTLRPADDHG